MLTTYADVCMPPSFSRRGFLTELLFLAVTIQHTQWIVAYGTHATTTSLLGLENQCKDDYVRRVATYERIAR